MASRTAWTAGNGQGLTYGTVINSADLASMPNGDSVLSSVADIANGTNLDMFMDISFALAISSSTIAAGANVAFWIEYLNQDGTTYGDGQLTSGTQAAKTPTFGPSATFPCVAAAAQTSIVGTVTLQVLRPGPFRIAMQNNIGFTLTSGTQTVKFETYNINLNS
jgi:hypothetical protein